MTRTGGLWRFAAGCFSALPWVIGALLACPSLRAQAKSAKELFTRRNTFGVFFAYSNDSSHILMGSAENRKLLNIGASYSRRIWAGKVVNWQYDGEIMPVALESDPVDQNHTTVVQPTSTETYIYNSVPTGACIAGTYQFTDPGYNGTPITQTDQLTCSRRWTIGEGMMPVGFQWSFLPRDKLQPYLIGHGGYMYSTQPIPTQDAGSFNFAFDFGAGFEFFRSRRQSIRVGYRYHHISNHDTATENPGIDNGLAEITYRFGR